MRSVNRRTISLCIAGAVTLFIAAVFALALRPVSSRSEVRSSFLVRRDTGVRAIGAELEAAGVIRSRGAFTVWSFFTGAAHRLQPGAYLFSAASSTIEIARQLREGAPPASVLIVEGETVQEIDRKLAALGIIRKDEIESFPVERLRDAYPFLGDAVSLEGFLFPDTYRFGVGSPPEAALRAFLENFERRALPLLAERRDRYDDLVIASLLEKEVRRSRDRAIVSGILGKRLALGMPLQVDATVVYAVCGGAFAGCAPLAKSDFKNPSPHNTYERAGLPPTPIANPGLDAISAAINPEPSPYLYYLTDPRTGRTVFAETFDEHNENRARYLGL